MSNSHMNDELKKLDEIVNKNKKYVRYVTIASIAVVLVGLVALVLRSQKKADAVSKLEVKKDSIAGQLSLEAEKVDSLRHTDAVINAPIIDSARNIIDRFLQEKSDSAAYLYYADTVENYFNNEKPFTFQMILERQKLRGRNAKIIYKKEDIIVTVRDGGVKDVILDAQYSSNPKEYSFQDLIYDFKLNKENKIFFIQSRKGKKYEGDL